MGKSGVGKCDHNKIGLFFFVFFFFQAEDGIRDDLVTGVQTCALPILPSLDAGKLERWRQTGTTEIFHYGDNCDRALSYEFVRDLERYDSDRDGFLTRPVPTKIVHGIRDDVIPVEASRAYARDRDWVELVEFDSDHTLASHGHPTIVLSYEFLVGRTVEDS